ncbi:hypothetical protein WAE58_04310 [Pedobacter panaciterrae]|uniref:Uncharacterized protein n=1 Tax=Pedobacter panaciterrae TaxID=363849 RepID=A0ABU8NID0_9SPHI
MKISMAYNPELTTWKIDEVALFMGRNDCNMGYGMGLTAPDPKNPTYSYFTVMPRYSVNNEFNGDVMICETKSCFQINNSGVIPGFDFLYALVARSTRDIHEIFNLKSKGTHVNHHSVPELDAKQVYSVISQAIKLAYSQS